MEILLIKEWQHSTIISKQIMKTGLEKIPLDNIDKLIDTQDVNWTRLALSLF